MGAQSRWRLGRLIAGQQVVEGRAQSVDIRALVCGANRLILLWGRITWGEGERRANGLRPARIQLCQPEIHQHWLARTDAQFDIGGLDITMDDWHRLLMQRGGRVADRDDPIKHLRFAKWAACFANVVDGNIFERLPVDIIHDEIEAAVFLKDRIGRNEVRVPHVEQKLRFEPELSARVQIAAKRLFERAIMVQHCILGAVDVAESTAAYVPLYQISALRQ